MAIPEEYKLLEVVSKSGNISTCKASHPIHGTVAIYRPEEDISNEDSVRAKRFLYRCSTQIRSISLLNLPFVIDALEVSQNPNDPYIVTRFIKHDLEELANDGITLKPKRTFQIISQLLQAISSLSENGWQIDRLDLSQIKFDDYYNDDVILAPIGNSGLGPNVTKTLLSTTNKQSVSKTITQETQNDSEYSKTLTCNDTFDPTITIDDNIDATVTLQEPNTFSKQSTGYDSTVTMEQTGKSSSSNKVLRADQRNIYTLGNVAFQLLLGEKYRANDSAASAMINKVGTRWRKVLKKALDKDISCRYQSFDEMLCDIQKALLRNKKIGIAAIPVLIAAMVIAGFFGYKQYKRHIIMASDTATAVENLIDIFDKEPDTTSTGKQKATGQSDDEILQPFEELEKTN